jgi:hypothetical protein
MSPSPVQQVSGDWHSSTATFVPADGWQQSGMYRINQLTGCSLLSRRSATIGPPFEFKAISGFGFQFGTKHRPVLILIVERMEFDANFSQPYACTFIAIINDERVLDRSARIFQATGRLDQRAARSRHITDQQDFLSRRDGRAKYPFQLQPLTGSDNATA